MATSWYWNEDERAVLIIQRTREHGRTREDRIYLTAEQIAKLAKETPKQDEGKL